MSDRKTLMAENLARYDDPAEKAQICLEAVRKNGGSLYYVPKSLRKEIEKLTTQKMQR